MCLIAVAWNTAAVSVLYTLPDLSKCGLQELQGFLASVKNAKVQRRKVQCLDLLLPTRGQYHCPTPLDDQTLHVLDHVDLYRADGPVFDDLISVFKNLRSLKIYGHGLTDGQKAHWRSLGKSLVELRVYNLGSLTDRGILEIASKLADTLRTIHLVHSPSEDEHIGRSLRVGTIEELLRIIPNLRSLGIGLPLQNIQNNRSILERLFDLETLEFYNVPNLDFEELNMAPLASKWQHLTVRNCPGTSLEHLDAVLRRSPHLVTLDWRFPENFYQDWQECELKTASCRKLKTLVLENACLVDHCLRRILNVTSQLETLALSACDEIFQIRGSYWNPRRQNED